MTARIESSRVSTGAIAIRDRPQQQRPPFSLHERKDDSAESAPELLSSPAQARIAPAHPAPAMEDAAIPAQTLFETLLLANRMADAQHPARPHSRAGFGDWPA